MFSIQKNENETITLSCDGSTFDLKDIKNIDIEYLNENTFKETFIDLDKDLNKIEYNIFKMTLLINMEIYKKLEYDFKEFFNAVEKDILEDHDVKLLINDFYKVNDTMPVVVTYNLRLNEIKDLLLQTIEGFSKIQEIFLKLVQLTKEKFAKNEELIELILILKKLHFD